MARSSNNRNFLHSILVLKKKNRPKTKRKGGPKRTSGDIARDGSGPCLDDDGDLDMQDQSVSDLHADEGNLKSNEVNDGFHRRQQSGVKRANDTLDMHNQDNDDNSNEWNTKTTYHGNNRTILTPKSILHRNPHNGIPNQFKNPFPPGFSPMAQQSNPQAYGSYSMNLQGGDGPPIEQYKKKVRFTTRSQPNNSHHSPPRAHQPNHVNSQDSNGNGGHYRSYKGQTHTLQASHQSQSLLVNQYSTSPANSHQRQQQGDPRDQHCHVPTPVTRCNCYRCVQQWKCVASRLESFENQVQKSFDQVKAAGRSETKLLEPNTFDKMPNW